MADLICYRGEKTESWGPATVRLNWGLSIRKPWFKPRSFKIMDAWNGMIAELKKEKKGPPDFAQTLRKEGRAYALATARTKAGSYTSDNNYKIVVPNARTFKWVKDEKNGWTIGEEVDWLGKLPSTKEHSDDEVRKQLKDAITEDYVVLNADSLSKSTVLAFGHKTGTFEVTFFTDVPRAWVAKVNSQPAKDVQLQDPKTLSVEDKATKYRDLIR